MKKIITAIGNSMLNDKLKEMNKFEIASRDIQYKEGILEILNERKDIDILIISEILEGEIDLKELINRIYIINSNIDIIVFLENENKDLRNFLYEKGIYKIYENNQINVGELISIIENRESKDTEVLTKEIKRLKQIIEEQKIVNLDNQKEGKIIAITGNYGTREKHFNLYTL